MQIKKNDCLYFIERLTIFSWLWSVLPRLIREHKFLKKVYYIDGSWLAAGIACFTAGLFRISVKAFEFRVADIRDEEGNLLSFIVECRDAANVQNDIFKRAVFEKITSQMENNNYLGVFLRKQAIYDPPLNADLNYQALLLTQYVSWKVKKDGLKNLKIIIFMNQRLWRDEISQYASNHGIKIIWLKSTHIDVKSVALALLGLIHIRRVKTVIKYLLYEIIINFFRRLRQSKRNIAYGPRGSFFSQENPRLLVEYYGQLNLDRPQMYSDLFFWQQSSLSGEDILVSFNLIEDPLDVEKLAQMKRYNIEPLIINPKASVIPSYPVFYHWPPIAPKKQLLDIPDVFEKKWAEQQIQQYQLDYQYWQDVFKRNNIKVYASWFKYTGSHCVIGDALQKLGGISTIYQRSIEEFSYATRAVASDIVFGFSSNNAEVLRNSGSFIPYHVAVGYSGDHRFSILKNTAQDIRRKLQAKGAKFILAFFDVNSWEGRRWFMGHGHESMRQNYEFLLKKVLSEPQLGVIFKPKLSSTLRRRLGPIAQLLKEAEQTGRCFVFEGGNVCNSYPPAVAALGSDVAIHSLLLAATAGIEAALAGVPTLLLDREGASFSKMYQLGKDRVVFTDWDSLWKACKDYWISKGDIPGFGDWSSLLGEMDPFRDGKAAERIGTYLNWLLDGFKAGFSRDKVLADAAERYSKIWGKDKITEVRADFSSLPTHADKKLDISVVGNF